MKLPTVGMINKLKNLFTFSIAALILLAGALPAAAQQNRPGSGLSISPTVSEFTIQPGTADSLSINLKNITTGDINAQASINDFEPDNITGTPKIITDPNKHIPNSIRKFVVGLEDVPLAKGEQKKATVALQIPKNATPGAYYGIIRYKAVPTGPNAPPPGAVSLSASVGTIVLVTVPGNLKQQLQLTAIHVYNGKHEGGLFNRKPDQAGIELKNLGNDFAKPFGAVTIEKMFSKQVYTYQLNAAQPRGNVLPGSSRIFKDSIKNVSSPGRYTITANVTYGNGNDVLVMKKTFWYIPTWLLIVILAVLVILVVMVLRALRSYRRSGRRSKR